ncbi:MULTISPECIES: hypothetical protein [unclassified Rhizobium]|uniref:hypothetical protein n=1 Tax=unclassified Rhizobium TaxID=2613769 RepID=UPI0011B714C4|nr:MULTISPECIES: hypothetical protein [unclassified Rhizobium]MDK4715165.1 hypothetical protein [Rhizobium sp. CNPSo 4039]
MDFLGSFGGFKGVAISSPHQSSRRRAVTGPKSDWRDSTFSLLLLDSEQVQQIHDRYDPRLARNGWRCQQEK